MLRNTGQCMAVLAGRCEAAERRVGSAQTETSASCRQSQLCRSMGRCTADRISSVAASRLHTPPGRSISRWAVVRTPAPEALAASRGSSTSAALATEPKPSVAAAELAPQSGGSMTSAQPS